MGGRGQSLGRYDSYDGGSGKRLEFYDLTSKYSNYTLHEFENDIRGKANEYIGVFDKDGKLIAAGTSYNKNSVALPMFVDWSKVETLTHNHPNGGDRGIGGTFSDADVENAGAFDVNTRAVAKGKGEHTYILNKRKDSTPNQRSGIQRYSEGFYGKGNIDNVNNNIDKYVAKKKAQGKTATDKEKNIVGIGSYKKYWRKQTEKYGWDYVESKKPRW